MKLKEQVSADLQYDEAFVSHVYPDDRGYQTIGFGRLVDRRLNGGITEHEAVYLLSHDISTAMADLDRNVPWWRSLTPGAQRALVNMAFNLGWPRLSGFKKMLAALKAGKYDLAAVEALDSKWAGQVGDRAKRIAERYRG